MDSETVKMDQDVMSTCHSKRFLNFLFGTSIINIDCERMLTNLDNITDDYDGHLQKMMILRVIQQIFCEMLIGGEIIVNTEVFF